MEKLCRKSKLPSPSHEAAVQLRSQLKVNHGWIMTDPLRILSNLQVRSVNLLHAETVEFGGTASFTENVAHCLSFYWRMQLSVKTAPPLKCRQYVNCYLGTALEDLELLLDTRTCLFPAESPLFSVLRPSGAGVCHQHGCECWTLTGIKPGYRFLGSELMVSHCSMQ